MGFVYGIGVNDLNYNVSEYKVVEGKQVLIWSCPFYNRWKEILRRCYSDKFKSKYPSYLDSYCIEEWCVASLYKQWMEQQDWVGKHLDKDILYANNKVYSPETCAFVLPQTNTFVVGDNKADKYTLGVYKKNNNKFRAVIGNPFTGKVDHLGYFKSIKDAHEAWRKGKELFALQLADLENDQRVKEALSKRYKQDVWYK